MKAADCGSVTVGNSGSSTSSSFCYYFQGSSLATDSTMLSRYTMTDCTYSGGVTVKAKLVDLLAAMKSHVDQVYHIINVDRVTDFL